MGSSIWDGQDTTLIYRLISFCYSNLETQRQMAWTQYSWCGLASPLPKPLQRIFLKGLYRKWPIDVNGRTFHRLHSGSPCESTLVVGNVTKSCNLSLSDPSATSDTRPDLPTFQKWENDEKNKKKQMSDPLPTSDQILTSPAQDFRNLKITHKPTTTMCHWQHLLR